MIWNIWLCKVDDIVTLISSKANNILSFINNVKIKNQADADTTSTELIEYMRLFSHRIKLYHFAAKTASNSPIQRIKNTL